MASPVPPPLAAVARPPVATPFDGDAHRAPGRSADCGLLVDAGVLTAEQFALATRIHSKVQASRPLSSVLVELKFVTEDQIRASLRSRKVYGLLATCSWNWNTSNRRS